MPNSGLKYLEGFPSQTPWPCRTSASDFVWTRNTSESRSGEPYSWVPKDSTTESCVSLYCPESSHRCGLALKYQLGLGCGGERKIHKSPIPPSSRYHLQEISDNSEAFPGGSPKFPGKFWVQHENASNWKHSLCQETTVHYHQPMVSYFALFKLKEYNKISFFHSSGPEAQ